MSLLAPAAPRVADPPTKAQDIHAMLADEIVHGRLAPGAALDEAAIAARYGVSRTPIREAIRRLEASGLALVRPRRGAVVTRASGRQLDEMFAVMAEMESTCARWAALAMTAAERARLEAVHEEGRRAMVAGDVEAYAAINTRFHDAVYAGAHNPFLVEVTLHVRRRCAPFRRAQFEEAGRLKLSHGEHDAVVRAIARGDAPAAGERMRAHLLVVRAAVDAAAPLTG